MFKTVFRVEFAGMRSSVIPGYGRTAHLSP
ncbi:hypothetical protein FHX69_6126 [Prauserella muralis]|nr:hypothetical protein FHX69_6126 [Prauserella muralis]